MCDGKLDDAADGAAGKLRLLICIPFAFLFCVVNPFNLFPQIRIFFCFALYLPRVMSDLLHAAADAAVIHFFLYD